jgi:hypothetical protein
MKNIPAGTLVQINSKTSSYNKKKGKIVYEEFRDRKKGKFYRVRLHQACHIVVNEKNLKIK